MWPFTQLLSYSEKETNWAAEGQFQLHSTTLSIGSEILVLTTISPCHPVGKGEAISDQVKACPRCNIHTPHALRAQNVLSTYGIQIIDRSRYCYVKWSDVHQILPFSWKPLLKHGMPNLTGMVFPDSNCEVRSTFTSFHKRSKYHKELVECGES